MNPQRHLTGLILASSAVLLLLGGTTARATQIPPTPTAYSFDATFSFSDESITFSGLAELSAHDELSFSDVSVTGETGFPGDSDSYFEAVSFDSVYVGDKRDKHDKKDSNQLLWSLFDSYGVDSNNSYGGGLGLDYWFVAKSLTPSIEDGSLLELSGTGDLFDRSASSPIGDPPGNFTFNFTPESVPDGGSTAGLLIVSLIAIPMLGRAKRRAGAT